MKKLIMLLAMAGAIAHAQTRLETIKPENYSAEQQAAAQSFKQARGVEVFGPFEPLMHSPEVMTLSRSMGDYLRYHSALGNTLSEFVILITARQWTQDYEWYVHYPIALKAGVSNDVAQAIKDGRRPSNMSGDEASIYNFVTELNTHHRVSDITYREVEQRFGKKGIVDLTAIVGYYTLLAMEMNVAQYKTPKDFEPLPRFPN